MFREDLFTYASEKKFPLNIVERNGSVFTPAFHTWIGNNLHIFNEFCAMAKEMKQSGRDYYGAKTIVEVIRWNTDKRERPDEGFKIGNNYTADMARLCMLAHPELAGFFRTKER